MKKNNKSTDCGTNSRLPWAIILLNKIKLKRGITQNIAFRVMPLALQPPLAMMSKYSKLIPLILLSKGLH